jgi:hypothetical protein
VKASLLFRLYGLVADMGVNAMSARAATLEVPIDPDAGTDFSG